MAHLITCASCGDPVKTSEPVCPHCGGKPRGAAHDGELALTAAALLLGLAAATGGASCGDDTITPVPPYGVAGTGGMVNDGGGGADGEGGEETGGAPEGGGGNR